MESSPKSHLVSLEGRDRIEADLSQSPCRVKAVACDELLRLLTELKAQHGPDPRQWPLPKGRDHGTLLVRELILKTQGQWQFPYEHQELCHCRAIPTHTVDQAIISGAHTPEAVSRMTSASTACGTCRPDVERILKYRLGETP